MATEKELTKEEITELLGPSLESPAAGLAAIMVVEKVTEGKEIEIPSLRVTISKKDLERSNGAN